MQIQINKAQIGIHIKSCDKFRLKFQLNTAPKGSHINVIEWFRLRK